MHDWIIQSIAAGGYLGIFLLMALENIFPPIPSELIMGLGGIGVAHGQFSFWPLLFWGTAGSTLGNYFWYLVGSRLGVARLRPFVDRWGRWLTMEWEDVETVNRFFRRHGHWVVFAARFSPLFRTMISLPAGLARMGHLRFLLYTFAGATIWNAILIGAGIWLGANFADIGQWTGPVTIACIVIMVGLYVWRIITWRPRVRD